jgi:Flp pilus assembly protein TadB
MLSQYDRQQLELISLRLQSDDPELAKALRDGKPRPLPVHRRWPYILLGVLAALVVVAGVLTAGVGLLFAGTLALAAIVHWYRRQARRSPRVRSTRRRFPRRG